PATINQGDSTTLTWSSTNSTSCSASWTNSTATSGTQVVSPVANTDYTVTCTGAGGSDDATATVTVRPLPTATLSINPSIINSGESATLTWSSTNTTDCSASWTLSTAIFGSQSISPTSSGDYSITCNGAGGSISKLVSLVVLPVGGSGVSSAPIIVPPQSTENPQGGFRVTASQLPVSSSLPLVKLKFSVGSDINRIAISNYPDFNNANIELYQPEINWSLLNNNKFQKVYVKFYNKSGQSSEIIVGDIILDDIIESNSVQGTDIVSKIINEKTEIFNQANPETYFINNGTDSTLKLGSGERAAAISSYKEAYGIAPKTAANWIDVLNIANGRWPITVIKTVEARAYTNFKLVYGRNADMKNSTDVNALKMMGYGVRSTAARNLSAEKNAAQTFIKTFGFSPSIARHWNVIRAIAYSGLIK
ncbi:MAG: hypothetical protein NTY12_00350, partial [Candidatus Falkowbacteria bacterium]|nr:hypothetical protein [Candidatus Falkowbacteria bacterium]